MKIKDIVANTGNIYIKGVIKEIEVPREFNKFGKSGKVCNAILADDSGEIMLTLWNEEADKFEKGQEIEIENGYAKHYKGDLQLTTGKFGSITAK